MATASNEIPPMPKHTLPMVDPKTGLMAPEWYRFLKFIRDTLAIVRTEIP